MVNFTTEHYDLPKEIEKLNVSNNLKFCFYNIYLINNINFKDLYKYKYRGIAYKACIKMEKNMKKNFEEKLKFNENKKQEFCKYQRYSKLYVDFYKNGDAVIKNLPNLFEMTPDWYFLFFRCKFTSQRYKLMMENIFNILKIKQPLKENSTYVVKNRRSKLITFKTEDFTTENIFSLPLSIFKILNRNKIKKDLKPFWNFHYITPELKQFKSLYINMDFTNKWIEYFGSEENIF